MNYFMRRYVYGWFGDVLEPDTTPYSPLELFTAGEQGVWYDPSDLSTLFQDASMTIPVTANGDPIGAMIDKSGNGNHAIQPVAAARPTYYTDGVLHWINYDGVDDWLITPYIPSSNWTSIIAVRVLRLAGFLFDSSYNSMNNYLASSNNKVSVFGAPSGYNNSRDFTLNRPFIYDATVLGDNIGDFVTIATRYSSGTAGFFSNYDMYGFILRSEPSTTLELKLAKGQLSEKSGVNL